MLRRLQKTLSKPYKPVLSTRPSPGTPPLTLINYRTIRMSSTEEPTAEEAKILFEKLERKFPSKTLGGERWYLVAVRFCLAPSKPLAYSRSDCRPHRRRPTRVCWDSVHASYRRTSLCYFRSPTGSSSPAERGTSQKRIHRWSMQTIGGDFQYRCSAETRG